MFITIEGIDFVGKSTQIKLLEDEFKDRFIFTKEPGGSEFGSKLRDILLNENLPKTTELFLFLADRSYKYEKIIKKDKTIISDRSFISGIAYGLEFFDQDLLTSLNKLATNNNLFAKVILLEISKDELKLRAKNQKFDAIEQRGLDYLLRIQNNLKKIINDLELDHIIIDASLDKFKINEKIKEFIGV